MAKIIVKRWDIFSNFKNGMFKPSGYYPNPYKIQILGIKKKLDGSYLISYRNWEIIDGKIWKHKFKWIPSFEFECDIKNKKLFKMDHNSMAEWAKIKP